MPGDLKIPDWKEAKAKGSSTWLKSHWRLKLDTQCHKCSESFHCVPNKTKVKKKGKYKNKSRANADCEIA